VGSNSSKKKSTLNYSIWYRVSILFLISITLVCSSLCVSPLAFSSNGTFITKWGEYGSKDGQMRTPAGIALDQEGNVYVTDTTNNRIQVFSSNGTFITKWGEYGSVNGSMRTPAGIAVDSSSGNVYVADTGNNIISAFTSRPPIIINVAFSSEEGERYMVMAQGGLHKDHAFQAVAKLRQRQDDIRKI